jgi:hypothetical protein
VTAARARSNLASRAALGRVQCPALGFRHSRHTEGYLSWTSIWRRPHCSPRLVSADGRAAKALLTEVAGPELRTEDLERAGVGARLDAEPRRAMLLGDVREAIFGAQDGLVSTLAVVSTVSGATNDRPSHCLGAPSDRERSPRRVEMPFHRDPLPARTSW